MRGTIRLSVDDVRKDKGKYYVKLSEKGKLYRDGKWLRQGKAEMAEFGPNNPSNY